MIDFSRDIKPILDQSCLRCHGPEKPKSRFRLDNHDEALKGGDKGVDIIPGDSARSPLIHYVAYLVEDLEMPPLGKGDQLTPAEVGLLRAWIDQGAAWDSVTLAATEPSFVSFVFGGTAVSGDSHQYREHYWQPNGFDGGAEQFGLFDQPDSKTKTAVTGHALLNDYKIYLSVDRYELGFVHSGWEQYRKYYDDTGGYRPSPSTPTALSLGRDLHLDIGKAWIDFGLLLPNWPQMVLGYEYDYKKGNEAITSWGAAGQGADVRNIAPASKNLDESVHIIKFNLDHDVKGITIEERFRGEFYRLNTSQTNEAARGPITDNAKESNRYFQGANTIRLEGKLTSWLFGSAGYLYSKLNADSAFSDTVVFVNSAQTFRSAVPQITLERESHVFNINGMADALKGFTISTGVQSEWTRQHGFGTGNLNTIGYTVNQPLSLAVNPATLISDYDENTVSEKIALRYTTIPFTVLFAEARLEQQCIAQNDADLQASGNFLENPSYSSQLSDLRAGFNTSPWRAVSLSSHYRRYENDSQYKTNQSPQPAGGYPGFIRSRDLVTDEVEAKLVLRPCNWLKTTLACQFLTTKYSSDTAAAFITGSPLRISPGGDILAGQTDSHIYSMGTTWTPTARFYLDATFSYQTSTTTTAQDNSPAIVPYKGNIYSVNANGTYVLGQKTDLFAGYTFSEANFGQNNFVGGVPLGIDYQMHGAQVGLRHRFTQYVSAKLQYRFNYYEEPTSGGANNYRAHTVFGTMTVKLP